MLSLPSCTVSKASQRKVLVVAVTVGYSASALTVYMQALVLLL